MWLYTGYYVFSSYHIALCGTHSELLQQVVVVRLDNAMFFIFRSSPQLAWLCALEAFGFSTLWHILRIEKHILYRYTYMMNICTYVWYAPVWKLQCNLLQNPAKWRDESLREVLEVTSSGIIVFVGSGLQLEPVRSGGFCPKVWCAVATCWCRIDRGRVWKWELGQSEGFILTSKWVYILEN